MKSYPKLFNEGRDALLELVANGVEAYYRQRTALEKTLPDVPPEEESSQGDFLHDFVSLNVEYLNQLARLGSNYSILGARALERIYEWMQPPQRDNVLCGKAGTEVEFGIFVNNSALREKRVTSELRVFSNGRRLAELPEHEFTPSEVVLAPGRSTEITLSLTIPREFKPGFDYQGVVVVTLGGQKPRQPSKTRARQNGVPGEKTEHLFVIRRETK